MAETTDPLTRLCPWHSERIDGSWEHGRDIRIETLDNPGWMVKIQLYRTPWQDAPFETIKLRITENDWLDCKKMDFTFIGAGDPSKLVAIVEIF